MPALPSLQTIKFFTAASLTSLFATFQMSYHTSVINIPEPLFIEFLNETNQHRHSGRPMSPEALDALWAWIVSIVSVGGLIGSLITPILAEKFGRKLTFMVISNLLAIGASVLMVFSQRWDSYEVLTVGRFVIGISSGISTTLLPVYLTECSPTEHRGVMGTLQSISTNLITVAANLIGMPEAWGNVESLPLLLSIGLVPALMQIISAFFLVESPKYLYIHKKNRPAAERSIRFWSTEREIDQDTIKSTLHEFDQENEALREEIGFFRAMRIPYYRRVMVISLVLMFCQAATAISAMISYSADMFLKLGLSQGATNLCTNMMAVACTLSAIMSGPCIERFSRRSVFFGGYILLVVAFLAHMLFAIVYERTHQPWSAYLAMVSLFVYSAAYAPGAGSLSWILPAELAPQAIRSSVSSVSGAFSWALALVTTFAYPPARRELGASSYLLFIIPLILGLVYLYRVMPETGGKSIAEIVQENDDGSRRRVERAERLEADGPGVESDPRGIINNMEDVDMIDDDVPLLMAHPD